MKTKNWIGVLFYALLSFNMVFVSCSNPAGSDNTTADGTTYTITYVGNGNDGGTEPTDPAKYTSGGTITVKSPGTLTKTGCAFSEWNTVADGTGTAYRETATLTVASTNITLYAQWIIASDTSNVAATVQKLPTFGVVVPNSVSKTSGLTSSLRAVAFRAASRSSTPIIYDEAAYDALAEYKAISYSDFVQLQEITDESLLNAVVAELKTFTKNNPFAYGVAKNYTFLFMEGMKSVSTIKISEGVSGSGSYTVDWTMLLFSGDATQGYTIAEGCLFANITITTASDGKIGAQLGLTMYDKAKLADSVYTAIPGDGSSSIVYYGAYDESTNKNVAYFKLMGVTLYTAGTIIGSATDYVSQMLYGETIENTWLWANGDYGITAKLSHTNDFINNVETKQTHYDVDYYLSGVNLMSQTAMSTGFLDATNADDLKYRWPLKFIRPTDTTNLLAFSDDTFYLVPTGTTADTFDFFTATFPSGGNFVQSSIYEVDEDNTETTVAEGQYSWYADSLESGSYNPPSTFSFTKADLMSAFDSAPLSAWNSNMISDLASYSPPLLADPSKCPTVTISEQSVIDTKMTTN